MTDSLTVLYLGPEPTELTSFLPTDSQWDVLGTVTQSPEAALARAETGAVDCLVVDTRLPELDVDDYLDSVASIPGSFQVSVLEHGRDECDHERYDNVVTPSDPAEARRETVLATVPSEPSDDGVASSASATNSAICFDPETDDTAGVLRASSAGIAVVVDGQITRANPRAASLLDIDVSTDAECVADQLSGQLYDDSGTPLSPTEFPFRQALSTGDSVLGYDADGSKTEGPARWLLIDGKPLPGADSGMVLTFKDVTWLKDHQHELERRRTELDTAVQELKRSNAELEQFAYVASHDLREPLRMVSNYLGLLERRYGEELDDDAKDFIEYAVEGAQRMRQFINDLLEYSRVGRDDSEMTAVDLETVVESVMSNLSVRRRDTDAEITVESLPTVQGNERRLEQLFQNLLSNAIQYAGDQPPSIEVTATVHDDHCEVCVADDGVGIDAEGQERAFDLFYTTGSDSTGIGLALSQKIVQRHGGEIWLDSTPGEGTTIHFTLVTEDGQIPDSNTAVTRSRLTTSSE